ncbi:MULTISPECIES: hypothetical protein [unclassified Spirosoma]|uniref:hypothetical protein n=1 Tax=unclassified Spirosoma TaxID=2621999 RepID=UPI00096538D2|nr:MULTISPECIES: hypothetical protein [unclassified Spirosoma]MBN8824946.1 hypothetical protein [Spirosoma sp.]OJW74737.1 MAG: hypothetical protein BGO59_28265 [Spirosoma sp. 48-14]
MTYTIVTYAFYLLLVIPTTVWVGHTLFRNGRIFLVDIFHANTELADSVNKLLLIGFYLLNIGYAVMLLRVSEIVKTPQEVFEVLSYKVGGILLLLGLIHLTNLYVLFKVRKRTLHESAPIKISFPER